MLPPATSSGATPCRPPEHTALRFSGRAAMHDPSRPTPNEILRERFSRGEITAQEFEDAKKVLGPDR